MRRTTVLICGVIAYAAFLIAFLYLVAFMAGVAVPKAIDSGASGSPLQAVLANVLLLGLFALQHTVMARDAFKQWWTKLVPVPLERSVFVIATSLVLGLIYWLWQPILTIAWEIQQPWLRGVLWCGFVTGAAIVLYSTFLVNHFDLFGLRQVWLHFRGSPYTHPPFTVRSLYKYVRHPMMFGILMTLWSIPTMTWGHLLFSATVTGYILFGIHMEERGLLRNLGADYARYRELTPVLIPSIVGRRSGTPGYTAVR